MEPLPAQPAPPFSTWEEMVAISARRALAGQTPPELAAYSFAIDYPRQRIQLRAHFDQPPSPENIEDIQVAETEIAADWIDYLEVRTEIDILPKGTPPVPLAGGFAWRRGDPEWRAPGGAG